MGVGVGAVGVGATVDGVGGVGGLDVDVDVVVPTHDLGQEEGQEEDEDEEDEEDEDDEEDEEVQQDDDDEEGQEDDDEEEGQDAEEVDDEEGGSYRDASSYPPLKRDTDMSMKHYDIACVAMYEWLCIESLQNQSVRVKYRDSQLSKLHEARVAHSEEASTLLQNGTAKVIEI